MAEYIDKDKLIDRFDELCNTICQYSKKQRAVMCSSCELGIAFDVVDDFSTEDVRPVVRGHWIGTKEAEDMGDIMKEFTCSVCGCCEWDCTESESFNFCPNCGADMRGEEDG